MESTRQNNSINVINDSGKLLNGIRSNLSHEETKRIIEKLYIKEAVYKILIEKEQKSSLTSRQKNMLENDERYLKNISNYLKNLKKHLKKYRYGLDYLFNEPTTSNNDISAIEEARKLFNERRSSLLRKETNEITKKLHKKEEIYNF